MLRGIVGTGSLIDDLPRAAELSEEGRLFLQSRIISTPMINPRFYLACDKISPTTWWKTLDDLRLLVRRLLPSPSAPGTNNAAYTEAWRGLCELVNIFQGLRGFHVEFEGLDTLSPPSMLDETSEQMSQRGRNLSPSPMNFSILLSMPWSQRMFLLQT